MSKNYFSSVQKWLGKANILLFSFCYAIGLYILVIIVSNVFKQLFGEIVFFEQDNFKEFDPLFTALSSLIAAPLIETFVFQALPYNIFKGVGIKKNWLLIIISAALFGAIHCQTLVRIIYSFIAGIGLMYGYILRHDSSNRPFISVSLVHFFMNLIIYTFMLFRT